MSISFSSCVRTWRRSIDEVIFNEDGSTLNLLLGSEVVKCLMHFLFILEVSSSPRDYCLTKSLHIDSEYLFDFVNLRYLWHRQNVRLPKKSGILIHLLIVFFSILNFKITMYLLSATEFFILKSHSLS